MPVPVGQCRSTPANRTLTRRAQLPESDAAVFQQAVSRAAQRMIRRSPADGVRWRANAQVPPRRGVRAVFVAENRALCIGALDGADQHDVTGTLLIHECIIAALRIDTAS
jgi:hypothetical protein